MVWTLAAQCRDFKMGYYVYEHKIIGSIFPDHPKDDKFYAQNRPPMIYAKVHSTLINTL